MEAIWILSVIAAFAGGWTLGHYNIPAIKLSAGDAIQDTYEDQHPHRLAVVDRDDTNGRALPSGYAIDTRDRTIAESEARQ